MTAIAKSVGLLAMLCLLQTAHGSFLAKKDMKGGLSGLDSPAVQKRLEQLSGMKVDPLKLKNSFATDPLALLKTVLGSKASFDYFKMDRSKVGALDKDTKVPGLELVQAGDSAAQGATAASDDGVEAEVIEANQPKDTPPFVEARMELAAPLEIWNDIRKDQTGFNDMITKTIAQEAAGPLKSAQIMGKLLEKGKLLNALQNPGEYNSWEVTTPEEKAAEESAKSEISNPEEEVGTDTVDDTVTNEDAKGSLSQVGARPLRLRQAGLEAGQKFRVPDENENEFVGAIEDDPEVEEMIKHDRTMDAEFPDDLGEVSDIKDWLTGKI